MSIDPANPFSAPAANLENPVFAPVVDGVQLAPATTRLVAVLLDGLLFLPAVVLGALTGALSSRTAGAPSSLSTPAMVIAGLYFLGLAGYQIYLLSTKGQTLGKRWMKIRIVKLDGAAPGFIHAVLLRSIVSGIPRVIPVVGNIFSIVDALFIFRQDRRCLHDHIASTRVILANR